MSIEDWAYRWASTPANGRANVWRAHRIDEILAGNTPRPLAMQPTVVLHVFPMTAFTDTADLPRINIPLLAPMAQLAPAITRANADGIVAISKDQQAYVQLFRDSTIEYASSDILTVPNTKELNGAALGEFLSDFIFGLRQVLGWKEEERTYALSLLHAKDHYLPGSPQGHAFDRDILMLPAVMGPESGPAALALRRVVKEANGAINY